MAGRHVDEPHSVGAAARELEEVIDMRRRLADAGRSTPGC